MRSADDGRLWARVPLPLPAIVPGWNSGGQGGTDSAGDPALAAVFHSLPGASFLHRQRRANPKASALTSAGAQLFITAQWSLLAKFDGEFAQGALS